MQITKLNVNIIFIKSVYNNGLKLRINVLIVNNHFNKNNFLTIFEFSLFASNIY